MKLIYVNTWVDGEEVMTIVNNDVVNNFMILTKVKRLSLTLVSTITKFKVVESLVYMLIEIVKVKQT